MGVLYIHFDPAGSFCASGFRPEPPILQGMRAWMAENPSGWQDTEARLAAHGFVPSREDALIRAPKGFETVSSGVEEALKLKSWVVRRDLTRSAMRDTRLVDALVAMAGDAQPLLSVGWSALDRLDPRVWTKRR